MPYYRINRFIIIFFIIYISFTLLGNFIIDYIPISFIALLIFASFYLYLYLGSSIGLKLLFIKRYHFIQNIDTIIYILLLIITISTFISWSILIKKYGSLAYIIFHAFDIRTEFIGKSETIIPVIYSYLNSLIFSIYIFCLVLFNKSRNKKYIILSIYSFIIIILNDLLTFGRIGILFAIFCLLGYTFYYKIKIRIKHLFLIILVISVLMLPRLIRGGFDNFKNTMSSISPHLKIELPSSMNFVVSNYVYYFSSLYAFSYYITYEDIQSTFGEKNFTPIYNIFSRFVENNDRISLIDEFALVPFKYNIYSITKDLLTDFGMIGLIFFSLVMGLIIGFSFKNSFHSLNIFFLGWLLFTPIYNLLSFGGFLFSLILIIVLTIMNKNI
jgi:oligosaccharide repeat unit polymerase